MRIVKKNFIVLLIFVFIMSVLVGCGQKDKDSEKLSIVCTVYPAYDFIMNIVGDASDDIEVTYLLEKGIDMHNFQPSAADIVAISQSDLFVYVGGESDSSVEDILKSSANGVNSIALIELVDAKKEELLPGMSEEHDHEEDHDHETEYDEHVWLSIKNAMSMVNALCDAVCEIDEENAEIYRKNTNAYLTELRKLDEKYMNMTESAERKVILIADRFPFAYLADDYGITCYAAFSGCSAETEASFETVVFLAEKINENKLPVIFVLENSKGAVADTVAAASKADNLRISILDSMQSVSASQIEKGYSYISVMEENLLALTEAMN